jgi:hypothetical protein
MEAKNHKNTPENCIVNISFFLFFEYSPKKSLGSFIERPKGAPGTPVRDKKNNSYLYYVGKELRKIPPKIASLTFLFFFSLNIRQKNPWVLL